MTFKKERYASRSIEFSWPNKKVPHFECLIAMYIHMFYVTNFVENLLLYLNVDLAQAYNPVYLRFYYINLELVIYDKSESATI